MKINLTIYAIIFCIAIFCCTNEGTTEASQPKTAKVENTNKPASSFSDTLKIDLRCAVFYYPDSLQLEKIKAVTNKDVYESSMHEYFYQLRHAHNILNRYWPEVRIIEAKNVRYLVFVSTAQGIETIDLNTKSDAYGLFVFDPAKTPTQLELTNAESEIGFYFSTTKPLKKN